MMTPMMEVVSSLVHKAGLQHSLGNCIPNGRVVPNTKYICTVRTRIKKEKNVSMFIRLFLSKYLLLHVPSHRTVIDEPNQVIFSVKQKVIFLWSLPFLRRGREYMMMTMKMKSGLLLLHVNFVSVSMGMGRKRRGKGNKFVLDGVNVVEMEEVIMVILHVVVNFAAACWYFSGR